MVFYLNIFLHLIYCCDGKAEFSALFLQSLLSHDHKNHSKMQMLVLKKHFILLLLLLFVLKMSC